MWKTVPIFDGRYKINENGDLYNSYSNRFIKGHPTGNGYLMAEFRVNGVRERFLLHRLVATLFIPNPNNYPIVLHLDNNPKNCNVSNLKWGTYSENNAQAIRDGLNKVPRPDNRKMYEVYHPDSMETIQCYGINDIIRLIGFGNDSSIRNYIFRKKPIPDGYFSGWMIRLA
jgi:uncharacterized HNH endonuclease L245